MTDPLQPLISALRAGRPPPFEWVVEWTSDGGLAAAWAASGDAEAMFELVAVASTPEDFARAVLECVHAARPRDSDDLRRASELVRRWITGASDWATVETQIGKVGVWGDLLALALSHTPPGLALVAVNALLTAVNSVAAADNTHLFAQSTDIVRRCVAPPTLAQVTR